MDDTAARHHLEGMKVVCLAPCVCKTPVGGAMVPLPYMVVGDLQDAVRTSSRTMFASEEAFTMNSRLSTLKGNEPGTGGGMVSGVNLGWCRPQTNKTSFLVDGFQVIQNDCVFDMNCAGPEGPSNTVGKLIYPDGVPSGS